MGDKSFNPEPLSDYLFEKRKTLTQPEGMAEPLDPESYFINFMKSYPIFNKKNEQKASQERTVLRGLFFTTLGLISDAHPRQKLSIAVKGNSSLELLREGFIHRAWQVDPVLLVKALRVIINYLNRRKILAELAKIDLNDLRIFLNDIIKDLHSIASRRIKGDLSQMLQITDSVQSQSALFVADLSLNNLPYVETVFHTFTGSKGRSVSCRVFDASLATPEDAEQLMGQLAGMEFIQQRLVQVGRANHTRLFLKAVRSIVTKSDVMAPVHQLPVRNNFILEGPSGVAKTIGAQAMGISMIARKAVSVPKIFLIETLSLRGEYQGETDKSIKSLYNISRGGILILDEFDALDDKSFDNEVRDSLNVGMEQANRDGTIVIATGYPEGIRRQFDYQPGLAGRFLHVISIPAFDDAQIARMLKLKIELSGLRFVDGGEDMAIKELMAARHQLGPKFTNGRAVEGFIKMVIDAHASQFTPEIISATFSDGESPANFCIIDIASIPQFNGREFTSRRSGLRLVEAAGSARRADEVANLA